MNYIDFIYDFFSHVKCANCHEFFTAESIHLIRQESNNVVVRIVCSHCGKNLGLAILGIDREKYKNSLKFEEEIASDSNTETKTDIKSDKIPVVMEEEAEPITYDDVIKAHDFFSKLGDDWAKFLPKIE